MHFGAYMGVFWMLKFALFPLGLSVPFLMFLFIGLTLCVPFMGYRYVRLYRDTACGGQITFLHAWAFTVMLYMFAALLAGVAHYIYFRYIDYGFIADTYANMADLMGENTPPAMAPYVEQIKNISGIMRTLTPIEITMQLMSQNVFYGVLLGIPTALFVMKKKSKPTI